MGMSIGLNEEMRIKKKPDGASRRSRAEKRKRRRRRRRSRTREKDDEKEAKCRLNSRARFSRREG